MQSRAKERWGWYFYDWANSAFSTTVITVFFGPYITALAKAGADTAGYLHIFGLRIFAGSFFAYVVSLSVLLQVFVLPMVGALADYSQRKKQLLIMFAYLGALATIAMYTLQGVHYLFGGLLFIIANVSFGASIVVYNAFLNDIAPRDERDDVSSKGFAWGYIGGGLLLGFNVLLFSQGQKLGLSTGQIVRINLASAGLWWAAFSLFPLLWLRNHQPQKVLPLGEKTFLVGFKQLRHTLADVRNFPQTLLFLAAFLLYNEGIQTVSTLAAQFGQEELHIAISTLTIAILMVQFVAFFGAFLFDYVASMIGNKKTIIVTLIVWIGILVYAYAWLHTTRQFFVLAAIIALVLGGSQALSRSLYSLLIPRGQESEYFGLYEISDKGTSWLGPLLFGLSLQLSGSYRVAILSLVVFFIFGLGLLAKLKSPRV